MRIKEINNLVDSLLSLRNWKNPLWEFSIKKKLKFDLLTGKSNYTRLDSVLELCKEKRSWFLKRISFLNGDLADFQKAEISVEKTFESIIIIYKNKRFNQVKDYSSF